MTDFANNPTALVVLCVLIAFICVFLLWIIHVVRRRRTLTAEILSDILAGRVSINDARRALGYPEVPNPLDQSQGDDNAVKYHHPAA